MTGEEFKKLKVGDRIKITSCKLGVPDEFRWQVPFPLDNRWNKDGFMDKYLGAVLTITRIPNEPPTRVKAKLGDEDWGNDWNWFPEMVECKVYENLIEII